MAATTNGQAVINAARWSDESEYLSEFVAKQKLPLLIKIVKGQCGAIGVPTLPNPGLQSVALLVSAGECRKILAQSIKIKNGGRKTANVGPRFTIPDTYGGYFELLSEEGRPMRSIESVSELGRRRLNNGYLVRESVRAIVGKYDENGGLSTDGARTVNAGETIFVEKKVTLDGYDVKLVRCRDAHGNIILLSSEQRGKFSVIAKEDNISGVHTAKNLLWKRLPMTVRLVHGAPPRGLKNVDQQFAPEMRLLSTYKEENVFAMPIQRDCSLVVALPLTAPIKLQRARNQHRLQQMEEYQKLLDRCDDLVSEARDKAHVFDGKAGGEWRALRLSCTGAGIFQHNYSSPCNSYFLRRSASASDSSSYQYSYASYEIASPAAVSSSSSASENRLDSISASVVHDVYDEIDEIYEYIRGYGPLPKCMRLPFANGANSRSSPALSASCRNSCSGSGGGKNADRRNGRRDVDGGVASPYFVQDGIVVAALASQRKSHEQPAKPEPPPIETIPSSKRLPPPTNARVAIASAPSQPKFRKADQSTVPATPQPPPIETIPSSSASPSSSSSSSKKPLPATRTDPPSTPSKGSRTSSAPTTPSSPSPASPYPFNVVTSSLAVTARPGKRKPAATPVGGGDNNNSDGSIYTNCAAISNSSPAVGGAFIASAASTVAAIAVLANSSNGAASTEPPLEDVKNVSAAGCGGNGQVGLLVKHYVKSGNSQTRRLLRQKSSSPLKEHHSTPQPSASTATTTTTTKSHSPMFNARYKSLNNLQQAADSEQSGGAGTLDSSHSGGRTSGDSNLDGKLPQKKRCKKLSRPRSLTNLVWDMRVTGEPDPGAVIDRKFKAASAKLENSALLKMNVNSSNAKTITASPKRIATLYL